VTTNTVGPALATAGLLVIFVLFCHKSYISQGIWNKRIYTADHISFCYCCTLWEPATISAAYTTASNIWFDVI